MSKEEEEQCCRKSFGSSLLDTATRFLKDPTFAPEEVQNERLEICRSCDHFNDGRCNLCGCVMRIKVKASNVKCPADKWLEYKPNKD